MDEEAAEVMEGIQPDEQARLFSVIYHLWRASNAASWCDKRLQAEIDAIRSKFVISKRES